MSQDFVRIGKPVNNRQMYVSIDEKNRKRYICSVPVDNADRFEKFNEEYSKKADALENIDSKQIVSKLEKGHVYTKARISGILLGLVGGGIPLALSMKFLKGTKRYIIGGLSAAIIGIPAAIAGYIGSIGILGEREMLKTPQGKDFANMIKTYPKFDMRIEKVENI